MADIVVAKEGGTIMIDINDDKLKGLREIMSKLLDTAISSKKSKIISDDKHKQVVMFLKNRGTTQVPLYVKKWIQRHSFQVVDMPSLNLTEVLVVPKKGHSQSSDLSAYLRVVPASQIVEVVYEIHANTLKHAGYKKVLKYVQSLYYGITRDYVQELCSNCPVCQLSMPNFKRPPLKPILCDEFLGRIQVSDVSNN
jgi:hypothetical protein